MIYEVNGGLIRVKCAITRQRKTISSDTLLSSKQIK